MAMKGYTHTLEAIIGSILLISSVTIISSNLQSSKELNRFDASLTGEITRKIDDKNLKEIEDEISDLLPPGYRNRAFARRTDVNTIRLGPDSSYYINRTGSAMFIHLFSEGTDFNISFRGNTIVKDKNGYTGLRTRKTEGFLNLTGSGSATAEAVNQSIAGEPYIGSNVDTYNFPVYGDSPSEVKISVWR